MPNLIKRIAKERSQVAALFLFLVSLVIGIPLLQVPQQALASNPGIGVTVTAAVESSGQIPVKQGSSIAQNIVVCVGYRVTFTAQGVPGGGAYQWEAVQAGANPAQGPHAWTVPADMADSQSMAVTFNRPGIYTAKVTYTHPDCEPSSHVAEISVLVTDDKLKKNGEYVPPVDDDDPGNDTYTPWGCPPPPPPPTYEEGDPCVCEPHLTVPGFVCVNDDDDQLVDSEYYEEWDWKHAPSPMDNDLRPVTVAVDTNKPGTLTLSIVRGGELIGGKFWKDAEKYEVAQTSWHVGAGGTLGRPFTFFVEGVKHSLEKEDIELKLSFVCDEDSGSSGGSDSGGGCDPVMKKTTVYQIDLDVDSDNQNGFEFAGFTGAEDKIENSDKEVEVGCKRPGKVVLLTSRKNTDGDDVPDYADGFHLEGAGSGVGTDELANVTEGLRFVPVQVELKEPFDPGSAKIKFTYGPVSKPEISDEGIERTGAGTEEVPYMFAIKKGGMRLWKKKPTERGSGKAVPAGDFIPADTELNWSDLVRESGARIAELYLEYVDKALPEAGGKRKITARVTEGEAECEDRANVTLLPVEVVELSPKVKDADGNDIEGSEISNMDELLTPFVEVDPHANKIAHRELKVKIGESLKGKKVTWTMDPLFIPSFDPNGPNLPARFKGEWDDSPTHKDRFEASVAYGANGFKKLSQQSGETTVADDGYTAIRVNIPPIGFNQARIKIQIGGGDILIDLIDMEVPGVVIIDPGHGGGDSGAVGRTDNSVLEKDLVLAYSLKLREDLIEKFKDEKRNLRVKMTRDDDSAVALASRAPFARQEGADIFVSIHFNSFTTITARGCETFVERLASQASAGNPGANVNLEEDAKLAGVLNQSLVDAILTQDPGGGHRPTFLNNWVLLDGAAVPGVKRAGKAVTRDGNTRNGNTEGFHPVKSCLIEVEFISNETALNSVKLSGQEGVAIKDAFSESAADDIFNNILYQQ